MNVLVCSADSLSAISWFRCLGPLSALERNGAITVSSPPQISWPQLEWAHVLFVNLPQLPQQVALMKEARRRRIPVVVDIDDAMLDVPWTNNAFMDFRVQGNGGREPMEKTVFEALQLADEVWVATEELGRMLKGHVPDAKIVYIPNALPSWRVWPELLPNRLPIVMHRGTPHHIADLAWGDVAKEIALCMAADEKIHWRFFGVQPWPVLRELPGLPHDNAPWPSNMSIVPVLPVEDFQDTLAASNAKVVIAPLADHAFNRGKSHNAWMESMFAGCLLVSPDISENVGRPGVFTYDAADPLGKAGFMQALERALSLPVEDHLALVREGRALIDASYRVHHTNQKRYERLQELVYGVSERIPEID